MASNRTDYSGMIQRRPDVPPGRQQRVGKTEVLDNLYYDTLLFGAGQTLNQENRLFTDAQRTRNDNLCNLKLQGQFTDNRQFAVYRFGMLVWSEDNPDLYDLLVYFSRFHIMMDESQKTILWGDQAGAGGGVYGFDTGAGAFHLTNGLPASNNQWSFRYPLIIVPEETFEWILKIAQANNFNPLTDINADEGNRLLRTYIRGVEGRNPYS